MSTPRLSLDQLERRAQKPDHRRIGNFMARRVSRPLALRVTWLIAPWGVSAHGMTLIAWATAVAAALALAHGSIGLWIAGAALLQLWYLLDHVDGQLARLNGTASLDGVQLDYLMHHTVHLLVPLGVGHGLFVRHLAPVWLAVGLVWGLATLLLGMQHDCRYKAFVKRLKRVRGRLQVIGGGGSVPLPAAPPPRSLPALAGWLARKAIEIHVVVNMLSLLALALWLFGDERLFMAATYCTGMAIVSAVVAALTIARSIRRQTAEAEFARWYVPATGDQLVFRDGWWCVLSDDETAMPENIFPANRVPERSS